MTYPEPQITEVSQPYWDGLKQGNLLYQSCAACGHAWLPPGDVCPRCLASGPDWKTSAGKGKLISWIVYHTAHHEAFNDRLPYNVAIVELDEGPRLLTNLVPEKAVTILTIGTRVSLRIAWEGNHALARFEQDS